MCCNYITHSLQILIGIFKCGSPVIAYASFFHIKLKQVLHIFGLQKFDFLILIMCLFGVFSQRKLSLLHFLYDHNSSCNQTFPTNLQDNMTIRNKDWFIQKIKALVGQNQLLENATHGAPLVYLCDCLLLKIVKHRSFDSGNHRMLVIQYVCCLPMNSVNTCFMLHLFSKYQRYDKYICSINREIPCIWRSVFRNCLISGNRLSRQQSLLLLFFFNYL